MIQSDLKDTHTERTVWRRGSVREKCTRDIRCQTVSWALIVMLLGDKGRCLISSLRPFWVGVKRHTLDVSVSASNKQSTLVTSAEHRGTHTRKSIISVCVCVCALRSVGKKQARWALTTYTSDPVMAKLSSITTLFVGHPFNGHNTEFLIFCRLPLMLGAVFHVN